MKIFLDWFDENWIEILVFLGILMLMAKCVFGGE